MERKTNLSLNNFLANIKTAQTADTSERKISLRQIMLLFFFTSVSGVLRILSPESGKILSKSSWLSPIVALLPILLLIFVLDTITRNHRETSLAKIIETVFGKVIGKIFLFLFFIHVLFFTAFFLRNFGEKFISSIFPNVSPSFFVIILLLFSLFAVRRNIESFARFSEFSFVIISAILVTAFFVALFYINPKNLYPVDYYDAPSVLESSLPLISLWSLLTFSLFLGDNMRLTGIKVSGSYKRTATKFMLIIALFNFLSLISIIGIFNAETASNISMPYFMLFKSIRAAGIIQSFETFFIMLWAFTDFIMITYYMFIISKIFNTLFVIDTDKTKFYMFPLAFIVLIISYIIGENNFEAEYFYNNILSYSSIILGYIFPFVLLAAGKIRRVL